MSEIDLGEILFEPLKLFDFLAYSGEIYSNGEKIIVEQSSEIQDWIYCFREA